MKKPMMFEKLLDEIQSYCREDDDGTANISWTRQGTVFYVMLLTDQGNGYLESVVYTVPVSNSIAVVEMVGFDKEVDEDIFDAFWEHMNGNHKLVTFN